MSNLIDHRLERFTSINNEGVMRFLERRELAGTKARRHEGVVPCAGARLDEAMEGLRAEDGGQGVCGLGARGRSRRKRQDQRRHAC